MRRYDVFISYSHARDGRLAPRLRHALSRLAMPWWRRSALRIFLDHTNLGATPGLWSEIERTLDASEYFVLLASPEAAGSAWVNREVTHWRAIGRPAERLLIVLTGGTLIWRQAADGTGDIDWERSDAAPEALRGAFAEEPRWVDLRWARSPKELSLRNRRFRNQVAELAAPIYGQSKDKLLGEDSRQHRRAVRLASITLAVGLVLTGSTGWTIKNAHESQQERQREETARELLDEVARGRDTRSELVLPLGVIAHGVAPSPATRASLVRTLTAARFAGVLTDQTDGVTDLAFSPRGRVLVARGMEGDVQLWDVHDLANPRPFGKPLMLNSSWASSAAFGPDGSILAVTDDQTVTLWDVTNPARPQTLGTPLEHDHYVSSVAFGLDRPLLVTGGAEGVVTLWDVRNPASPKPLGQSAAGHPGTELSAMALSPNGRTVATGGLGGKIRFWDVTDPVHPRSLGELMTSTPEDSIRDLDMEVRAVVFSPGGDFLATSMTDMVRLWDVRDPANPQPFGEPLRHSGWVSSVEFSHDGDTMAAGDTEGAVVLWDVADPTRPRPIDPPLIGHSATVSSMTFSAHDDILVTGSSGGDSTVRLWDVAGSARPVPHGELSTGHTGFARSTAISPATGVLAAAGVGDDGTVRLWDVSAPAHPKPLGMPLTAPGGTRFMDSVAFSANGHILAISDLDHDTHQYQGWGGVIRLWDVRDPANPSTIGEPIRASEGLWPMAFTPDGELLATGAHLNVRLWDVSDPANPQAVGPPLRGEILADREAAAFSSDGQMLAVSGYDEVNSPGVNLWDVSDPASPQQLGQVLRHPDFVVHVVFSPTARILATGSQDGTVTLWDIKDPTRAVARAQLETGYTRVDTMAFSADGHTLATAGEGMLSLWDLTDPANPSRLGPPLTSTAEGAWSMAFSADGNTLIVTGRKGKVSLWDLTRLNALRDDPVQAACARGGNPDQETWAKFASGIPYRNICTERSK